MHMSKRLISLTFVEVKHLMKHLISGLFMHTVEYPGNLHGYCGAHTFVLSKFVVFY